MKNRTYRIPAIDLLGRIAVQREMASRGYENTTRTLKSWVDRRQVPYKARTMLLEMAAARRDVTLDISKDFDVERVKRIAPDSEHAGKAAPP